MYDFRIDQPAFVQALNEYKNYIRLLEERQSDLEQIRDRMAKSCTGLATAKNIELYRKQLTEGNFAIACSNMQRLSAIMEEELSEINALLVRCEGFASCVTDKNGYTMTRPAVGDNRVRNGGILALEYARASKIHKKCESADRTGAELRNLLSEIVSNLSGELETAGDIQTKINSAYGKINGISYLKNSFVRYEKDIKQLEYELTFKMSRLARDVEYARKAAGITREEARNGYFSPDDPYNYYDTEEGKVDYARRLIDAKADKEMMELANEIFAKDRAEWTAGDVEIIAQTFDYAIKEKKVDMIDVYAGNFYIEETSNWKDLSYREKGETLNKQYSYSYTIAADSELIFALMEHLDPETQGEAYYTLNRLSGFQAKGTNTIPWSADLTSHFDMSVNVVDGEIKIVASENYGDKETFEFVSVDVGAIAREYISEDAYFTQEMAESLCLGVINENDVEFFSMYLEGNYEEAVKILPRDLSDSMKLQLSGFMATLLGSENDKQLIEVENFVNTIFRVGSEYGTRNDYSASKWIETLAIYTGSQRELYNSSLWALGEYNIGGNKEISSNLAEASAFWSALYAETMFCLGDINQGPKYLGGNLIIGLDNLENFYNVREFKMIFKETNDEGETIEEVVTIEAKMLYDYEDASDALAYEKVMELQAQIDAITEEFLEDVSLQMLQDITKIPVKKIGDLVKDYSWESLATTGMSSAESITNINMDNFDDKKLWNESDKWKETIKPGIENGLNYFGLIEKYYKKSRELKREKIETCEEDFYKYFGSCYTYKGTHSGGVRGSSGSMGIFDPDIIEKCNRWSHGGVGELILNPEKNPDVAEWSEEDYERHRKELNVAMWAMVSGQVLPITTGQHESTKQEEERLKNSLEAQPAVELLILGNDATQTEYNNVLDIPPEIFVNAITLINTYGLKYDSEFSEKYKEITHNEKIPEGIASLWDEYEGY